MLIGKNGQNLEAFERLVRLLASSQIEPNPENDLHFIIDINDYRKSRTDYLIDIAKDVAQRVIQTQRAEALSPMSSYERRLVHTELASYKEIQTESVGQEPRRRIIVKPQPEQLSMNKEFLGLEIEIGKQELTYPNEAAHPPLRLLTFCSKKSLTIWALPLFPASSSGRLAWL